MEGVHGQAGQPRGPATSARRLALRCSRTALIDWKVRLCPSRRCWTETRPSPPRPPDEQPEDPVAPPQMSYIITCIDSRAEPAAFLGVDLGDATVQRVVGGRVTSAVLRDVAYISYLTETKTPDGPWWEVAVIHHTDCGSTLLADPELRRGFAARGGSSRPNGLAAGHRPRRHRPGRRQHLVPRHSYPLSQGRRVRLQHRCRHRRHHRRSHPCRQALTAPGCGLGNGIPEAPNISRRLSGRAGGPGLRRRGFPSR